MYICCIYLAVSKNLNKLPNCLKTAETRVVFDGVLCEVCVFIILPFLTVAQHKSVTRIIS